MVWSVCLSVKSHLTYGASVRPANTARTQRATKICGVCQKRLRSRVMPRTNIATYPRSAFSQRSARWYPTIVYNIRPCPKRCPLIPLTRVVARTESTTLQLQARRGQYSRTHWHSIQSSMQYAPRVWHFILFLRALKLAIFFNLPKFAKISTRF